MHELYDTKSTPNQHQHQYHEHHLLQMAAPTVGFNFVITVTRSSRLGNNLHAVPPSFMLTWLT
jgi:hypothetical protein